MGWLIDPDGLYHMLTRVGAEVPSLPIYITENGCAADDYVNPDGEVNDFERIDYIRRHLEAALSAIDAGVKLAGYFHWSLMDNFEWAEGYQPPLRPALRRFRDPAPHPQAQRCVLRAGRKSGRAAAVTRRGSVR